MVLLLTDGLADTPSPGGERFGVPRALEVVRENRTRCASDIVEAIFGAARAFLENEKQEDDCTVVVLKVQPE